MVMTKPRLTNSSNDRNERRAWAAPTVLTRRGRFISSRPAKGFSGLFQVKVSLKRHPEMLGVSKVLRQPDRRIRRDAPFSENDLVDPARRHVNFAREGVLTQIHGLEKFFQQHFAWM